MKGRDTLLSKHYKFISTVLIYLGWVFSFFFSLAFNEGATTGWFVFAEREEGPERVSS